jgi:hypothetical protein
VPDRVGCSDLSGPPAGVGMRKVLIVTHELLAGLPASFLDRRNLRVRTADSAEDAARVAQAWRPDLVIAGTRCAGAREIAPRARLLLVGDQAPRPGSCDAWVEAGSDVAPLLSRVSELLDLPTRSAPRLPADFMAEISGQGGRWLGRIISLSETGVLLDCEDALPVNGEVVVQFHLPGRPQPVAPRGRIVSVDAAQHRAAVAFIDGETPDRDAILSYVEIQTSARAEVTRAVPEE